MEDKEPDVKKFDKCPACGSTERQVADLARKEGLENPEMYGLNCRPKLQPNGEMGPQIVGTRVFTGPMIDDQTMLTAIVGHKFPIFSSPVDACGNCGLIYTIQQQVREGHKLDPQVRMVPGGPLQGKPQNISDLFRGPF